MTFAEIYHLYRAKLAEAEQSRLLFRIKNNCDEVYGRHIAVLSAVTCILLAVLITGDFLLVKWLGRSVQIEAIYILVCGILFAAYFLLFLLFCCKVEDTYGYYKVIDRLIAVIGLATFVAHVIIMFIYSEGW